MSESDQTLRALVLEACSHPPGTPKRQRALTQVIRLTASKLWRDSSPHYADALQQTWVYFCQNVCEGNTGAAYDSSQSSVATWLNAYLKRRLQDFFIDTQKQQATRANPIRQSPGEVELDPVENLAAAPDAPPILDEVQQWAAADLDGELRQVKIAGSAVSCQTLILRRLPPEASWKELAAEYGLSISTLSSFYQRQCLPRLRKFGETQGYL